MTRSDNPLLNVFADIDSMIKESKRKNDPPKEKKKRAQKSEPWKSTDGFWRVYKHGKVRYLHRVLVEEFIGRSLRRTDIVKFKDGNVDNLSLNNLVIASSEGIDLGALKCPNCQSPLIKSLTD